MLAGGTYLYRHTAPGTVAALPPAPISSAASQPGSGPRPSTHASNGPAPSGSAADRPSASVANPVTPVPRIAPFGTSEEVFESGARLYAANCAGCHGRPGKNASGPAAGQFWDPENPTGTHAVSQPVGAIFQAISRGGLVQGMPSYGERLTDTEIWDLALLLKNAHEELPEPVLRLLRSSR